MADLAQPGDAAAPADSAPTTPDAAADERANYWNTAPPFAGGQDAQMAPPEASPWQPEKAPWPQMPFTEAAPLIKQFENPSGDPSRMNYLWNQGKPDEHGLRHTAGGDFQITDQNWQRYAPQVGIDLQQYPSAASTAVGNDPNQARALQYKVAEKMYNEQGWAPWVPYNQRLRDYLSGRGVNTAGGGRPGGGRNPYWQRDLQAGSDFDAAMKAAQMSPEERAAYDRIEKAFEEETGAAKEARQREANFAEEMANKLKAENPAMLQWAQSMPSEQAMYGASMQLAPLLAIFTALGGRANHLTGLQMLSATTGIVQGLNTASKEKYESAMEQWKMGWEQLQAHQRMENEYYRMMLDAYAGRADAEEKAALSAEKMMGNMRTEEQRRQTTAIQALRARQAAVAQAERLQYLYANLDERIKRDQDYHARITALDNAINSGKVNQEAMGQVRMWKAYLDEDNRRIQDDLRQMQQIRQDPSLDPEDRANQLALLQRDMDTVQSDRFDHIAQLRSVVMGGMSLGGANPPRGGAPQGAPAGQAAPQAAPPAAPAAPAAAPLQAPQNLPQTDPTDPTRKLRRIPNPNPAQPLKSKIWVYASDDGSNWRPLTPQEQARADQQDAQPPASSPSAQAETQSQWGGAM